ncbi:hypothetical protein IYR97_26150 (plasmid) [Pseudomonas fulva]|jgi:hypothetical protein|uniref:Uncharacterized protein n=4 Tax=Pseudomonas TaxID=286 RepID=A0A1X1A145_PSEPU|nr:MULTISPECIES: hypothetical protein [Pseudomonas]QDQ70593.1 hypothetical protein pJBCL41_00057 [Pseudomonas sp.]MCT8162868.1 hypothetical protein [Pseudomonas sp. HD6422]MCT8181363.1 hypothetical protein [Pseudomonas sp. HD6421]MDH1929045.1 hypothetical protein [Pseudomonas sp. GD03696]MDM1711639.1 hypothetical protein [Pseudomonas sp. 165]
MIAPTIQIMSYGTHPMKSRKTTVSEAPNLEGLTQKQQDHVLKVFPETRASMADYLRQGAQVCIYPQNEVPEAPPVAIALLQTPEYWFECVDTVSAAVTLAAELGLVVASILPRAP